MDQRESSIIPTCSKIRQFQPFLSSWPEMGSTKIPSHIGNIKQLEPIKIYSWRCACHDKSTIKTNTLKSPQVCICKYAHIYRRIHVYTCSDSLNNNVKKTYHVYGNLKRVLELILQQLSYFSSQKIHDKFMLYIGQCCYGIDKVTTENNGMYDSTYGFPIIVTEFK